MMNIPFYKMHGAANDFIVVDDRELTFPSNDMDWMAGLMQRHTGIGSEGVLLIQPTTEEGAHFRMRFFNPDGGEVDMCGNGARCIARLAHEFGVAPATMTMQTAAGLVDAEVQDDQVRLTLPPPHDWQLDQSLTILDRPLTYHFVNSGVPHVVIPVADVEGEDLARLGAAVRYHPAFAPAGTNVNIIQITGDQQLSLRTYERGVEAETLACGTGMIACALIAGRIGRCTPPVTVKTAGGFELTVGFRLTAAGATDVTLSGPAAHVFQGHVHYSD